MSRITLVCSVFAVLIVPQVASGQGLLFKVPEPGAWVRYEGTVQQWDSLPDPETGEMKRPEKPIEWQRHLHLKCVGQETAKFRGSDVDCRWIEIKVITGVRSELGPDPGDVGSRVYKVLVPSVILDGKGRDARNVPVDFIPIVKGYKRIAGGEVTPIRSKALRIYPLISLLGHYRDAKVLAANGNVGIPAANSGTHYSGVLNLERNRSQAQNAATYWVSNEIPFGIAKWEVTVTRKSKDITDPRSSFQETSQIKVQMQAQEVRTDAETEIDQK